MTRRQQIIQNAIALVASWESLGEVPENVTYIKNKFCRGNKYSYTGYMRAKALLKMTLPFVPVVPPEELETKVFASIQTVSEEVSNGLQEEIKEEEVVVPVKKTRTRKPKVAEE